MTKAEETRSIPITKRMVWEAYLRVKENNGGAGVDQVDLDSFQKDLAKNLYRIWNRMSSGSYYPPPVREVEIPKKDGRVRKLGIPTVGDRIAQQVVKNYLEPRLEGVFHENSYGYRPKKDAHQAIEAVRKNVRRYGWVIDMDIKSFFDEVDHELLMKALERHVEEKWVKMYVNRWLEMPIMEKSGSLRVKEGKGTPQGGVISPLLANLFLHYALDQWLQVKHRGIPHVRYADDVIIHCKSEAEAERMLKAVKDRLEQCKLRLHEGKTKIVYCQDYKRGKKQHRKKFDFLGFSFQPRPMKSKRAEGGMFLGYDCAISTESRKRILSEIRATKFHRWSTATIEDIAKLLNPKLSGWVNYYGKFGKHAMNRVFRMFHNRLVKWVLNRYKSLKHSKTNAYVYLKQLQKGNPIFYHWKKGFTTL
jgi:RNA-directed DNA polymerase